MNERILLVQLADIGDLILTTPAMAALREAHPNAHIGLLTLSHTISIIEGIGLVDEIIALDRNGFNSSYAFFSPANLKRLRHLNYDTVVYFHHFTLKAGTLKFALIGWLCGAKQRIGLDNGNGWFLTHRLPDNGFGAMHQAQYWLNLVGLLGAKTEPRPLTIASENESILHKGEAPRIIIHPGSGGYSPARRWPAEHFATVAKELHRELNADIVLVGTENDHADIVQRMADVPIVNLSGQTTLRQLAALLKTADVFIGADSGVGHIAAAAGTPTITIFGPSNYQAWHPWTPEGTLVVLHSGAECSPCSYVKHHIGLREGCAARTCMKTITPSQVVNAAKGIVNGQIKGTHLPTHNPQQRNYSHDRIRILGVPIDAITYEDWLTYIDEWVHSGRFHHVCTTNPEFLMVAQKDDNFRHILERADLCVPDGVGLLWAARRLGKHLPQRVTGSDGVPIIAEKAAEKGWKLFLLGAGEGIAQRTAEILQERYPKLQIAGVYAGSPAPEEEDSIVEMINRSGADILFVAYGAPKQDKWIARNAARLHVKMAMGVGGAFDFIAGVVPRAPLWMRNAGLEWLYRLYKQPWRIGRMLRLPRFVIAVLLRGEK